MPSDISITYNDNIMFENLYPIKTKENRLGFVKNHAGWYQIGIEDNRLIAEAVFNPGGMENGICFRSGDNGWEISYGTESTHINFCYYFGIRDNGSFGVNDDPVTPIRLGGTGTWRSLLCLNPKFFLWWRRDANSKTNTQFDSKHTHLEISSVMLLCFAGLYIPTIRGGIIPGFVIDKRSNIYFHGIAPEEQIPIKVIVKDPSSKYTFR